MLKKINKANTKGTQELTQEVTEESIDMRALWHSETDVNVKSSITILTADVILENNESGTLFVKNHTANTKFRKGKTPKGSMSII